MLPEVIRPQIFQITPNSMMAENPLALSNQSLSSASRFSALQNLSLITKNNSRQPAIVPVSSLHDVDLDIIEQTLEHEDIQNLKPLSLRTRLFSTFAGANKFGLRMGRTRSGYKVFLKPLQSLPESRCGVDRSFDSRPQNDVAVYRLSKILGMNNVPPTVLKRAMIGGREHLMSAQLWIDKARPFHNLWFDLLTYFFRLETNPFLRAFQKTDNADLQKQLTDIFILNYLADIRDLHSQNVLADIYGNLIKIDNGLSFNQGDDSSFSKQDVDHINLTEEDLQSLEQLTRADLCPLEGLISNDCIDAILRRRDRLVEIVRSKASQGETVNEHKKPVRLPLILRIMIESARSFFKEPSCPY